MRRRFGQGQIAAIGGERAQTHRCHAERRRIRMTEQRALGAAPGDADQYTRYEAVFAERRAVVVQRGVGFGRAGDKAEDRSWQITLCRDFEIIQT